MKEMFISDIWSILKTSHGSAILLKPKDKEVAVPIFIGALEMQSILIAKEGMNMARPLTHDLFINMLNHVNLTIKRVEVYALIDDVFHARLVITGGEYTKEKPLVMDSRPSDAFAMAARKKCPIYLSASVIEQTGVPIDFFINDLDLNAPSQDTRQWSGGDRHRSLREQLRQAVAEEEYEQAAEIRDLLKMLDDEDES